MKFIIKDKQGATLHTKDKFVTEDIQLEVDESILGGGGVEIPSVTDLVCDSGGNVSWTAPNFDSLADYEYSISYVVSVNDSEVEETTSNSIKIKSYLVEGTNTIYVKVKAILTENGINTIIQYSPLVEATIEILSLTLPYNLSENKGIYIDNNIYIFGGRKSSSKFSKEVLKIDLLSNTVTTVGTLPAENVYRPKLINNELYIFRFDNVYKYDLTNNTYQTYYTIGGANYINGYYNGYIYTFTTGGIIKKYDMNSNTLTTLENKVSNIHSKSVGVEVKNKVYIFTYDTTDKKTYVSEFDMSNENITDRIFEYKLLQNQSIVYKGNFYIFGGYESSIEKEAHKIYKLNLNAKTFEELTNVLPHYIYGQIHCLANNDLYIIGGAVAKTELQHYNKEIIKISNFKNLT